MFVLVLYRIVRIISYHDECVDSAVAEPDFVKTHRP